MKLGPWQSCIGRLATTPEQAIALLRDAVAVLGARGKLLAAADVGYSDGVPAAIRNAVKLRDKFCQWAGGYFL
jgi:hypothetical protein